MQTTNSKMWAVPLFCLHLGIAFLVVFWIAGNPGAGVGPFAIMVGYGSPADRSHKCASAILLQVSACSHIALSSPSLRFSSRWLRLQSAP